MGPTPATSERQPRANFRTYLAVDQTGSHGGTDTGHLRWPTPQYPARPKSPYLPRKVSDIYICICMLIHAFICIYIYMCVCWADTGHLRWTTSRTPRTANIPSPSQKSFLRAAKTDWIWQN